MDDPTFTVMMGMKSPPSLPPPLSPSLPPSYLSLLQKTATYCAQRAEQILELAMRWAPAETSSILQEYIRRVGVASTGLAHHSGVSLATAQINKYFQLNSQNEFLPVSEETWTLPHLFSLLPLTIIFHPPLLLPDRKSVV